MGRDFTKEQKTVCALLLASFILGVFAIYFNRIGQVQVGGKNAIYCAIALMPLTLLYVRKTWSETIASVLTASLAGITLGGGFGFFGLGFGLSAPRYLHLGVKWTLIGIAITISFVFAFRILQRIQSERKKKEEEDARFERLSDMEKLISLEESLSKPLEEIPKSSNKLVIGTTFMLVGLLGIVREIAITESVQERWIMVGTLVFFLAIMILFIICMRRFTWTKLNAMAKEVEELRIEALRNVRQEIARRQAETSN